MTSGPPAALVGDMEPYLTTSITAGGLPGRLFWSVERSTFGVSLDLFGGDVATAQRFEVGTRFAEFITVDRLLNQLELCGRPLADPSREVAMELRHRISRTFGDAELIGLTMPAGPRLLVVLPDGSWREVRPELDDPGHRFGWGRRGPASVATARALVRQARSAGWGPHEEMLMLAVAQLLDEAGPDFAVSANALCDWYLVDVEPSMELDQRRADAVRWRVDERRVVVAAR